MGAKNPFLQVEKILKSSKYSEALVLLLGSKKSHVGKGARIVPPYNSDLNHAWYLVGVVFYKQGKFNDALLAFRRSYRHWNKDVAAIRAIGNCYSELRNPKTAKYYFIKAISIAGKGYKDIDILIYNLGNAYFDLKKYDLAIAEYKKVRKSDRVSYNLAQKNIKHAQDQWGHPLAASGQQGA
jgi:tetratricopeptide (TPR) repeat protein